MYSEGISISITIRQLLNWSPTTWNACGLFAFYFMKFLLIFWIWMTFVWKYVFQMEINCFVFAWRKQKKTKQKSALTDTIVWYRHIHSSIFCLLKALERLLFVIVPRPWTNVCSVEYQIHFWIEHNFSILIFCFSADEAFFFFGFSYRSTVTRNRWEHQYLRIDLITKCI